MHKKLFNERPFVEIAIYIIIAIIIASLSDKVLSILLFSAVLTIILIRYGNSKNGMLVLAFVLFLITFFNSISILYANDGLVPIDNSKVSGRVQLVDENYYVLDSVSVKGVNHKYNIELRTESDLIVGDIIEFHGELKPVKYGTRYLPLTRYINKTKYTISTTDEIVVVGSKLTVKDKVINSLKSSINSKLSEQESALLVGVLLGDRESFSEDDLYNYKTSGIMHMFAVSGMHLTIFFSFFYIVCKRIKIRWRFRYIIPLILTIFYAYICGFKPSVNRALIMLSIFCIMRLIRSNHDTLTALAVSCIVELTIRPLLLFSLSFIMSYVAVISIVVLSTSFKQIRYLPKKISVGINTVIAVNIGLLPVYMHYFGTLATYSIIANMVLIPIIPILFVMGLLVSVLSLIPYMSYAVYVVKPILYFVNLIVATIAKLPFNTLFINNNIIVAFAIIALLIISSHYIFVEKKVKVATKYIATALVIAVICTGFMNTMNYDNTFTAKYHNIKVITLNKNSIAIVKDDIDFQKYLDRTVYNTNINEFSKIMFFDKNEEYKCNNYDISIYNKNLIIMRGNKAIIYYNNRVTKIEQIYNRFYCYDYDLVTILTTNENINLDKENVQVMKVNNNFTIKLNSGII